MTLCSIACIGQDLTDSIKVKRSEYLTILVNLSEKKAETKSLKDDIGNYKLIIDGKDVVINDYIKIISNHEEIKKGLENALKSVKASYNDAKKRQKWKWLVGFLEGCVAGAAILFGVLVF